MTGTVPPLPAAAGLEPAVADVEQRLSALAVALGERDSGGIDAAALALQRALAGALDHVQRSRPQGPLPAGLQQRLLRARSQVAAQLDTLARASAALERAIGTLLPRDAAVYTAQGAAAVATQRGSVRA